MDRLADILITVAGVMLALFIHFAVCFLIAGVIFILIKIVGFYIPFIPLLVAVTIIKLIF